ncbi:MAG: efflux RND transporter periplasmic adaptor subunit [Holophagales bacterium]|nr:efflux RND transporter periplasmic adaptor subunit [Holophagales bacterium]
MAVLLLAIGSGLAGCSASDGEQDASTPGEGAAPETRVRVRTQQVRLARLQGADSVTGTIRAYHRTTVTAETQGRVVARALLPGSPVEAGGLLVELEDARQVLALRRAEATLGTAETVLRHAERELTRGEQLLAQKALSTQQHDDLRLAVDRARNERELALVARDTARRDLADTKIRAPFAGTVDTLAVDVGDFVSVGTPVATLVDLSRVRIFGGVTAREAARLTPGMRARVAVADLEGRSFEAALVSVARVAGRLDGTYELELGMDNPGGLRDGMVATIELESAGAQEALLAPRAALLRRAGRPEVFVVERGETGPVARARGVRTGRVDGDSIEILEGLQAGEEVVFEGHFALQDGAHVAIDGERG